MRAHSSKCEHERIFLYNLPNPTDPAPPETCFPALKAFLPALSQFVQTQLTKISNLPLGAKDL